MARYDEITRKVITLGEVDVERMEDGVEIPVRVDNTTYHIRIG